MKILIIRLGAVGDIIRTVPAVLFLKENLNIDEIHWIAEDWSSNLLQNHPDIKKVYVVPRKKYFKIFNILKNIRKENYDYVFDFHGILKSGLISFFSGCQKRIGFHRKNCKEMNFFFNNIKAPYIPEKVTRIEKNFNLIKPLIKNFKIPDKLLTNFFIEKEKKEKIDNFFSSIEKFDYYIGVNPCTSKSGAYKEWPIPYFKEFIAKASKLLKEKAAFIITWGPGEFEKVKNLAENKNTFIAPDTDMKELMELISRLDFFITGDTGPMHLASTLNIPILALFGPSDAEINKPWGHNNIIAKVDVGCNPCRNKKCNVLKCQWELKPDIVLEKFKELIKREV